MKKTAVERAIEKLDDEIKILQLARAKLVEQQQAKPARKPKAPRLMPGSERSA